MPAKDTRRLWLAVLFSMLAHVTAALVLLPVLLVVRAMQVLFERDNDGLRIALLLAVLLHLALLLPAVHWLMLPDPGDADPSSLQVDLWDAARAAEEEKTPEEQLAEYDPPEQPPELPVVRAPASKDSRPPKDPRYAAERDSRVEQESVARVRTPGAGDSVSRPESPARTDGDAREAIEGGLRAELMGAAPLPSDLARAEQGQRAAERQAPSSLRDINLRPTTSAMMSALAGTGLDRIDDVIEGDHTALNTMGWEYASFFNRVKQKVEQYWHPDVEWRLRDPYGNVYGIKDRVTVLLVVLRADGSLKKLYVMQPSGAPFLDDEAYGAVQQAAPFPNVPPPLVDERDGLVKFTFSFIVEVGSAPVFRMRRYR
ncbi:MAG TPA: TonB C-terminal domain-containing protein [Polyangia bacterium]|nr:TonB C-terminal domain-containing protein [Polyangia bacterium]